MRLLMLEQSNSDTVPGQTTRCLPGVIYDARYIQCRPLAKSKAVATRLQKQSEQGTCDGASTQQARPADEHISATWEGIGQHGAGRTRVGRAPILLPCRDDTGREEFLMAREGRVIGSCYVPFSGCG